VSAGIVAELESLTCQNKRSSGIELLYEFIEAKEGISFQ
jgi:hypothetical protein